MGRQKLINLHNAGSNAKPKAADMEFGEIAVNHAPGNEKLWIKSGSDVVAFDKGTNYANHYTPSGGNATGNGSTIVQDGGTVVTSVTKDGKGHITGVGLGKIDYPTIPGITVNDTGSGNAVTDVTASGHTLTLARGKNFSEVGHAHDRILNGSYGTKITSNGYFMPVAGNEHIGMQNDPWDKAYIAETVGNLTGKATNAGSADKAIIADSVATEVGSSDIYRPVFFGYNGNNKKIVYNDNFKFNPTGGKLQIGNELILDNGTSSWGAKIDFCKDDQGYVYLHEDSSDHLRIHGNQGINLTASNGNNITVNGNPIFTKENLKEAYLGWGGKNHVASYGPIDAAMVGDLGANRFAFLNPDGVSIEYSRDNGSTWSDYGCNDSEKIGFFTTSNSLAIGKSTSSNKANANCLLRVTLASPEIGLYTVLNKFVILCSTNGCSGCYCTIQAISKDTENVDPNKFSTIVDKQSISGWSGYNVINISGLTSWSGSSSQTSQNSKIRFIFGCTSGSTEYTGLSISSIKGFGGVGWSTPSNMARNGHLYSFDSRQRAFFPEYVSSSGFIKSGYDDSYVLKAGGGAELESSLSVASAVNADKLDNLHAHAGRNNEANKVVRTDGSGYIQCGYINSSNGDEKNNSNPSYVWGTNGKDSYLRTYKTSALEVSYSNSSTNSSFLSHDETPGKSYVMQYLQTCTQTKGNDLPTEDWYHVLKFNHGTGDTYYKRNLALEFHSNRIKTNYATSNGQWKGEWETIAFLSDIPAITINDDKTNGEFITDITASKHTITVTRTNKIDCGTFDPQP